MAKRKRRTLREIKKIREQLLTAVERENRITLSQLVSAHGAEIGVKDSPSDKNLVKKQLDQLQETGRIRFDKVGRDLVASVKQQSLPQTQAAAAPPAFQQAARDTADSQEAVLAGVPMDLQAIRAYAVQLDEFAKALQRQIRTLVRMVEKAAS